MSREFEAVIGNYSKFGKMIIFRDALQVFKELKEMEKGNLSINSENILPVIKKWLYSDSDIFLRELVSNGCDAVNKLKKLVDMGEAKVEDDVKYKITVRLDKENKTIEVIKNLWRAGKDMSIIKIASGWDEEQIMQVLKSEMN